MQNLGEAPQLIQFFQTSAAAQFMRGEKWRYPAVEILHLAGLILVFGSVFVLNLRIFGRVLRPVPVEEVARVLAPITLAGLSIQVLTGPLLFIASAARFYTSVPFWTKIALLAAALAYHFFVHRPLAFRGKTPLSKMRLSAALSMILWAGVVLAGLAIELLAG